MTPPNDTEGQKSIFILGGIYINIDHCLDESVWNYGFCPKDKIYLYKYTS